MEDQYDECVEILQKIGVNFVGIDFDVRQSSCFCKPIFTNWFLYLKWLQQTFITKHTGGRWGGGAEELATASRPEFVQLVPKLINNGTVPTFNLNSTYAHRCVSGFLQAYTSQL